MDLAGAMGGATPSFYELVAAEALDGGLGPALKYLLTVIAARFPLGGNAGTLLRWSDELQLGVLILIQRHYLGKYAGSFAEHFYMVRRIGVAKHYPDDRRAQPPTEQASAAVDPSDGDGERGGAQPELPRHPLTPGQQWWSLLFVVVAPYVEQKLVRAAEESRRQPDRGGPAGVLERMLLHKLLPAVRSMWKATAVVYQVCLANDFSERASK